MQNNNKLFLIDGMALIYRAYYALIRNPLVSSKGLNTSAIFGFVNSLMKLIKEENPEFISVILDTKAPTFRHKSYDLYKAHRKPMPDDLSEQIVPLINILTELNIKIYKKDGYEADDLIGTIVKEIKENKSIDVFMYSGDKDLMQLVDDNIFLYSPGGSFKPTKIYGCDDVYDRYGVRMDQFIDYLALLGDSSDNIPGVKGVGAKTASKLLSKYDSIEKIYKNIDTIDNPRLQNLLLESKDSAYLSKYLATIDCNVDFSFKLEDMKTNKLLLNKMISELHKVEIYTFDKLLENKSQIQPSKKIDKDYQILDTENKIELLLDEIKSKNIISIDLETTSLDANIAEIVGVSLSFQANKAYYIPFKYPEMPQSAVPQKFLISQLKKMIEDLNLKFIGQNIKYDALVLMKYNIFLENIYFDTMIAESLIAPEKNIYNLNSLSGKYLGYEMTSIDTLIGKNTKYDLIEDVPLDKISFYACEDADVVYQIYLFQKKFIKALNLNDLFYNLEIPFINVLVDLEYNGVYVDLEIVRKLSKDLNEKLKNVSEKIYLHANKEFNINSPQQLAVVLFDEMKLKMFKKRSTSVEVLKKLFDFHPIAEDILNYRHLSKLINTYLDKLPNHVNVNTKRIHTSFNQAITSTGRLSSTKPNFQNIPIKTDIGKSIRKAFCVQNPDNIIVSFDYSQIELRILAHYSNEEKLIRAFKNNLDIHSRTAALVYGINDEDVEYNHRRVAKMINYSIAYGAGPFRISEELKIPIKQAKVIIDNYFDRYPGIKNYIDEIVTYGTENGYVKTFMGRRRNTINLRSSNRNIREAEKRATINMPIQGTASELIKIAMISIRKKISQRKLKSKMILQIHDELLFEIPKIEMDEIMELVTNEMVKAIQFKVPIVVDSSHGKNWYEAH